MNNTSQPSVYFWCCIAQSVVIVALAFYVGALRKESEQLAQQKEMASFALTVREGEISELKAMIDSCHAEKK